MEKVNLIITLQSGLGLFGNGSEEMVAITDFSLEISLKDGSSF